ncbi:hypothetical protein RCL1_002257 [Eukaryota sp. TZLM3-RCL]
MEALRIAGVIVAESDEVLHCRYFGPLLDLGSSYHRDLEKRVCTQVDESSSIVDDFIVVRHKENDLCVYILGGADCAEVVLRNAVATLFDAFEGSPLQNLSKETFEQNLSYFMVAVDELFDDGYVFETSAANLKKKIQIKSELLPIIDMSIGDVLSKAKTSFFKSLLQ